MAIKRYFANSDSTITNAMKSGLSPNSRGDESNMGKSDILEVFSLSGQITGSISSPDESQELSRILLKFPVTDIASARTDNEIPASGSVSFFLNLYNAEHSQAVPENFTLAVLPVAEDWDEGVGLDMENYQDKGEVSWKKRTSSQNWTTVGGHYHAEPVVSASFDNGLENLSIDISTLVEEWLAGTKQNYGIGIKLINEQEAYFSSSLGGNDATYVNSGSYIHNPVGMTSSMYTKKFFARGSQFYFKRPTIEARWDSSKSDDRLKVYNESDLASTDDNTNKLYLYNKVRGARKDIPNLGLEPHGGGKENRRLKVGLYTSLPTGSDDPVMTITGSWVETGIYSASFTISTTSSTLYDLWYTASAPGHSDSKEFKSGTITIVDHESYDYFDEQNYVVSIPNLKSSYQHDSTAHFRTSVRKNDWEPTTYTTVTTTPEVVIVDNMYYRIVRMLDRVPVLDFGTGSANHTKLSYDVSGNYFNIDLSFLKKDEQYGVQFLYKDGDSYIRVPKTFKFVVSSEGTY